MKIVDLQIRIARKMASGRGSMQITQTDLDVLVQSGAYAALCDAATEELKEHRTTIVNIKKTAAQDVPDSIRGSDMNEEVTAALARAEAALKPQFRARSNAPILPTLIKGCGR